MATFVELESVWGQDIFSAEYNFIIKEDFSNC